MMAAVLGPIATLGLTARSFLFVPYGQAVSPSLAASGPTISCDGRVPGSTLELTHWTDNVTPRPLPHVQSGLLAVRPGRSRTAKVAFWQRLRSG